MFKNRLYSSDTFQILRYLLRWIPIAVIAGLTGGTASAVLLVSLVWATDIREAHRWLIALLPVAGLFVGLMYKYLGASVEAGNNLILDEIHDPKRTIPVRMTPLILIGTFMTHLFGGSAGREGTAIQTGASLADQLGRPFRMEARERRVLLMAGISAGFASVFGTPLAGAIFGLEVLALGAISYDAIAPCFIAACIGDLATHAWGVQHTLYRVAEVPSLLANGLLWSAIAGAVFGLVGMVFAKLTHAVSHFFQHRIAWAPLRPFAGGTVVALGVLLLGTTRYVGLGIPTIQASFGPRHDPQDWLLKLLFTVVTLGAGFKGGEVTPLFFIGATLGNALAYVLPLPPSLLAGMGFVAVFAGAANTPIASSLMAMELFGAEAGTYAAIACVFSYLFSGHAGIYTSQRIGRSKHHVNIGEEGFSLALVAKMRDMPAMADEYTVETVQPLGGTPLGEVSILRLYLSAAQTRRTGSWWKKLAPQSFAEYLLQQAKRSGVEQALLQRVIGGYLKDHDLAMDAGEIPHLSQCLDLLGSEETLQDFLRSNHDHLTKVHSLSLRAEDAQIGAAVERAEQEQVPTVEPQSDPATKRPSGKAI